MRKIILTFLSMSFFFQNALAADIAPTSGTAETTAQDAALKTKVAGDGLDKPCHSPYGALACVMMAMTVVQVVQSLLAKGGAGNTQAAAQCTSGIDCTPGAGPPGSNDKAKDGPGTGGGPPASTFTDSQALAAAKKTLGDLSNMGYKTDSSGNVTMPNGQTVSPASMASAAGMKDAGFSDAQIATAQAALAKINDDFKKISASFGAGGGGGGAAFKNTKFVEDKNDINKFLNGLKGGRGIASVGGVEGLQKNMGNDSIGVAGDNIFKMIHRRYDDQRHKNVFVP